MTSWDARERSRRFEAARRAAMAISPALTSAGFWAGEWLDHPVAPETSERYRWLIAAMGLARGTAGGLAIARLASRGYATIAMPSFARLPSVLPLDGAGAVTLGAGLPHARSRWSSMEHMALGFDIDALPMIHIVSAHETMRIRSALRQEGRDVG